MTKITQKDCNYLHGLLKKELIEAFLENIERVNKNIDKVNNKLLKNDDRMERINIEINQLKIGTMSKEERLKTLEKQHVENRNDHKEIFDKIDRFIDTVPSKFTNKDEFIRLQAIIDKLMISTIFCFLGLVVTLITNFL